MNQTMNHVPLIETTFDRTANKITRRHRFVFINPKLIVQYKYSMSKAFGKELHQYFSAQTGYFNGIPTSDKFIPNLTSILWFTKIQVHVNRQI